MHEVFTGLIQDVGHIVKLARTGQITEFTIHSSLSPETFQIGESIAVDGICFTVVRAGSRHFTVEASPETLHRTTLGDARPGHRVNLERALRLSDRLGGHLVTGHIDGLGRIRKSNRSDRYLELSIETAPDLDKYLVDKGSVAVDGISLTINRSSRGRFDLTVIPHTIQQTTLAHKRVTDRVNLECDIVGKYVEKLLRLDPDSSSRGGISTDYLREHGFL